MNAPQQPSATSLIGRIIESQTQASVRYHLERLIGSGGMGSAYLAKRRSPEGSSEVVIKLMSPSMQGGGVAPEVVALKEAVALGRLNEVVPPTPFVVRFVDCGTSGSFGPGLLPWTAIEYVHGGVEGTTLEDRITYSVHKTGFGFDRNRLAHAIRCLASGLTAIHGVGVLHRDLSPGNVLCCGFGETELFKIADFGISRATGLNPTFAGIILGTLGYSAPEATVAGASPASDVFSLAALVYHMLTGQHYFDADTPMDAMRQFMSKARPKLADNPALTPELLDRPAICQELDRAFARATAVNPSERPQTASEFATTILPCLGDTLAGPRSSRRRIQTLHAESGPINQGELQWLVRNHALQNSLITSVAWDADGHALVLTQTGALFWNGHAFLDANRLLSAASFPVRFVRRYEAGGWLLGGQGPGLLLVDAQGVREQLQLPETELELERASGRCDDLLVVVAARPSGAPALFGMCARRWLKPVALPMGASVAVLERLDDSRWLVAGRLPDHGAFAALYTPMHSELSMLQLPPLRAIIAGASVAERSTGLLVGSAGAAFHFEAERWFSSRVPDGADLSVAGLDILNREWAASRGALFSRTPGQSEGWQVMWRWPELGAPFVSMMADAGLVVAMTADGAIVEGRLAHSRV